MKFLQTQRKKDVYKRQVIIRTLDIGGDKCVPYLDMPKEMNPFLGYRAIRLCLGNVEVFRTQLRAILRASVYGNVKIMIPMISTMKELKDSKKAVSYTHLPGFTSENSSKSSANLFKKPMAILLTEDANSFDD